MDSRKYKLYITTLYSIVIATALALAYEIYCRKYLPRFSIAALFPVPGASADAPGSVAPGKGFGPDLGYIGSALMILSQLYPLRKRSAWFAKYASKKFWLDTHIFLGVLGAVFITFHTTFKIGGIVSVSYWSMVVVVMSGVIGRFLYVQIPRSIAGNELTAAELSDRARNLIKRMQSITAEGIDWRGISDRIAGSVAIMGKKPFAAIFFIIFDSVRFRMRFRRETRKLFRDMHLPRRTRRAVAALIFSRALLVRRIARLEKYQELLEYWRPIHVWLSIVMFTFMAVHVAIAFFFYVNN